MVTRPAPNPVSPFSLLGELPVDALEAITSLVLEQSNTQACVAGGMLPAISNHSGATWSKFALRGFYANGFFHVTTPLECELLRLNTDNTDFVTGDVTARPIPHLHETHQNGQALSFEYLRRKTLHTINESGFEFVVDGAGNLRLNLANAALEAATESEELTRVTDDHLTAEEITKLWINELVVLPEARLVPFAAPELRPQVCYTALSKGVVLMGRPRVFAQIPLACRVPFNGTSIWYSILPKELNVNPYMNRVHSRRPPEHTFECVLGCTLWWLLCGTNLRAGPALLEAFSRLPTATKTQFGVSSNCFAPTAPGERLRRKSRVSAAEAARATAAVEALYGLLDF